MSKGTQTHIKLHDKPGRGSVFSPDIDIDDVSEAVAGLSEEFFKKGGGVQEVKVPNAGFDLVRKSADILKKYPNAKKVTVKKRRRSRSDR